MKTTFRRWLTAGLSLGLLAVFSGCVATAGYDGGDAVYGGDYYEPGGYVYGHWHEGYHVAPPRGHEEHREVHTAPAKPAYRPAPSGHSAPSLPSHSRSSHH